MSMSTLNARLEYLGGNTLGRIQKDKLNGLRMALANDYNSRLIETYDGQKIRGLININNLKPDYDKKILSAEFNDKLKEGDVFRVIDDNTRWMVYLPDLVETAYLHTEIIRCRYTLNIDEEEYWIYFQGPTETDLRWFQKKGINANELNLSGTIFIKDTPKTREFFTRFTKIKLEGHMWEIQVTDYISVPGIIELEIQEYYDNSIVELPEVIKVDDDKSIMGQLTVEPNNEYGYEINPEHYHKDYEWKIEGNSQVVIKNTYLDNRMCKVKVLDKAKNMFYLYYGDKQSGYGIEVQINTEPAEIQGPTEVRPYDIVTYRVEDTKGYFDAPRDKVKITKIDDSSAKIEILVGRKDNFNLYFVAENGQHSILPITVKSF